VALAADFEKLLSRFPRLDPAGSVRGLAAETRNRAQALARQADRSGPEALSRAKLAVDELRRTAEMLRGQVNELVLRAAPAVSSGWWGGPAGSWEGPAQRDSEHARRRIIAGFEHARRDAVAGFDAVVAGRGRKGAPLPDAPLSGSLFAWRILNSSLDGGSFRRPGSEESDIPRDRLLEWLMGQLDEMSKALLRLERGAFREPSSRWVDSARGFLRY
jgi:hypothetical protein